jgi:hypothetical protein
MTCSPVVLLSPIDNVAVCRRSVTAGEMMVIGDDTIVANCDVPLGHKIARRFIPTGADVVKYGVPIGLATADILAGDWVHLHNLRSDYMSADTRNPQAPA